MEETAKVTRVKQIPEYRGMINNMMEEVIGAFDELKKDLYPICVDDLPDPVPSVADGVDLCDHAKWLETVWSQLDSLRRDINHLKKIIQL